MRILLYTPLIFALGYGAMTNTREKSPATATFAGGCFWCMEAVFEELEGVQSVVSGYMGGTEPNPTYQDYAKKGYVEVIHITYDPEKRSYKSLLETFWRQIDPTDADGQFADRGPQYRSIIFYHTPEQKAIAQASKEELETSGRFDKPIVTEISPATAFHPAEEYHQDYKQKNPLRYGFYRWRSGRDQRLQTLWDKPTTKPLDAQIREKLTPLQYSVTQLNQTEPPFKNEYWNNTQPGIYVDIVSSEPLFSSRDKFDSNTGWPSYTQPLVPENLIEIEERGLLTTRTEVRSKRANSHLGHVFKDGPEPTGLRYCINSAALRFIPEDELEQAGYGRFIDSLR